MPDPVARPLEVRSTFVWLSFFEHRVNGTLTYSYLPATPGGAVSAHPLRWQCATLYHRAMHNESMGTWSSGQQ